MPGTRRRAKPKITWTHEMNVSLLECRDKAKLLQGGENPPRKVDGRKVGYMELMHKMFLEKFPDCNSLNPQNLRDKITHAEKYKHSSQQALTEVYNSEVNSLQQNVVPPTSLNSRVGAQNNSMNYLEQPLNEMECKACLEANKQLNIIHHNYGIMQERRWTTRNSKVPSNDDIKAVSKIINKLLQDNKHIDQIQPLEALWLLDCIIYVSIISWYMTNDIRCEIKSGIKGPVNVKPKWLIVIEDKIIAKRKLISKSVAEIERLRRNGRITRRTKRNRKEISKLIGNISNYTLTKLVCKSKAEIHRLSQRRKKKLRNEQARKWNNMFKNNQSRVFNSFKDIIQSDVECDTPKFKEIDKTRKYFEKSEDVLQFWKSLWCRDDKGNPGAEWLHEYMILFETKIPEIYSGDIDINDSDVYDAIKRKRNWSSPGPDLIVNFWLKKLNIILPLIRTIFKKVINAMCEMQLWFTGGRTCLLEKPDGWAYDNTRPITCTNNIYKWFTSLLLIVFNRHKNKYNIMQMDQRGAKEKCSGTLENLLIDDMVLKDAHDGKRNLSCGWIDVKKAYDSLSHTWTKKMLAIHRFPTKLQVVLSKIMDTWNTVLVVPLKDEDFLSQPIRIRNGVLQGDVISGNLFTLALNPVSWELSRYNGYKMSKPLSTTITHLLFMDDLKIYAKSLNELINVMDDTKSKMHDSGLEWNRKKCKVINLKRGNIDTSKEHILLSDGTNVECLKSNEVYKFLGVPENVVHDVTNIVTSLLKAIKQRTHVIWSSPLSDFNKVMATNVFVNSAIEYFLWSEKFTLSEVREMDLLIRETLNNTRAKYKLQTNSSLYLPRTEGGRGLRNIEFTYKKTRVKAAMNLLTSKDPRISSVREFERKRIEKGRSSVIKDALRYAKDDFAITFEPLDNDFVVSYEKDGEIVTTSEKHIVTNVLKNNELNFWRKELRKSTWQGVIFKIRDDDEMLVKSNCYSWLSKWKQCPVQIVNDFQSIYLQTVPTLTFIKHRGQPNIATTCRMCSEGQESIKHLFSNCPKFLNKAYKRRHDRVLQYIMFNYLADKKLIESCPPWYSNICIKPLYEDENVTVLWDIPEYSGYEDESDENLVRPDGKIILKDEKCIYVLEMSVPWVEYRETKADEKVDKYKRIIQSLKVDYPTYTIKQLTFIIDCLGGYSDTLPASIKCLNFSELKVNSILFDIQKIIVTEAVSLVNHFKIMTKT